MKRYRLAFNAQRDLVSIAAYIAEDNETRAVTFIDELTSRFEVIGERPLSFPVSRDLPAGVRSVRHKRYRIIFDIVGGIPRILHVLHSARDIRTIIRED